MRLYTRLTCYYRQLYKALQLCFCLNSSVQLYCQNINSFLLQGEIYVQNFPPGPNGPQQPYQEWNNPQQPMYPNPYQQLPGYGQNDPKAGLAIAAFIVGIASIPCALFALCGIVLGIIGIVLGSLGKQSFSRRSLALWGLGLSVAGLTLGVINSALGIYLFFHPLN